MIITPLKRRHLMGYPQQHHLDFSAKPNQDKIKQLSGWVRRVAVFPTQLTSGKYVWLKPYLEYHDYSRAGFWVNSGKTMCSGHDVTIAIAFDQEKLNTNASNHDGCTFIS